MPLMIKLNRNIMKVYLCLDNGHFITVDYISEQQFVLVILSTDKENNYLRYIKLSLINAYTDLAL